MNSAEVHIQQVHKVRWLTMHRVVEAIWKWFNSLPSTISILAANNDVVTKGLYKSICTFKFIVFTHSLCNILGDLTYLSCFFQKNNLDFSQVQSAVEFTFANIRETYLESDEDHKVGGNEEIKNPSVLEVLQMSAQIMLDKAIILNFEERFPDLLLYYLL